MAKVSRKLLRELKELSETPLARLGVGVGKRHQMVEERRVSPEPE